MAGIKGDFTGFTFKDIHSSDIGLTRVSGGDRFSLSLLPSLKDRTGEAVGANRTYYFGTNEISKEFNIEVAFDALSETNFRALVNMFSDYSLGSLIFDELPYKYYLAKLKEGLTLNYVCFLNSDGARVYKGESTLTFIAYDPMAYSRYKFLDEYIADNIPEWDDDDGNKDEWSSSLALLDTQGDVDKVYYNLDVIDVYNPGDKEAKPKIYVTGEYNETTFKYDYNCKLSLVEDTSKQLIIYGESSYPIICVDMSRHLTLGCNISSITYNTDSDGIYYKDGSNYLLRVTGSESAPFYNINLTSLSFVVDSDLFYAGNYFGINIAGDTDDIYTLSFGNGVGATKVGKIVGIEYLYTFY